MKIQNMVPEVYYKDSRDFSYIGRILEVLINYLKTNTDLVNSNLNTIDSDDLLNSLAYTLGFQPKHKYINKDLINICSNFSTLIRNKGNLNTILECIKILLNSQHIKGVSMVIPNPNTQELLIGIPYETKDRVLLEDLFDYLLPAGWVYTIVNLSSIIDYEDIYYFSEVGDSTYNISPKYVNVAQVARIKSVDSLNENITDVSKSETTTIKNHSMLWSGVVFGVDVDSISQENNGGE